MKPTLESRTVPAGAMFFAGAMPPVESPRSEEDHILYPFTMTARTPGIATHPYWGRCIHDFAGLRPTNKALPVDYGHNQAEVIGFVDKVDTNSGSLMLGGSLVSLGDDDRAAEVAKKRSAGVPYQASVMMGHEGLVYEDVPQGASVTVNGETVEGPLVVFRQWSLRGVAVLLYGSDPNTGLEFGAGDGDSEFSVLAFAAGALPVMPRKTGADYLAAFGDLGGIWFAQGKPFDECLPLFQAHLRSELSAKDEALAQKEAELQTMRTHFKAVCGGEPVSFQTTADATRRESAKKAITGSGNLDKFAASIEGQIAKFND